MTQEDAICKNPVCRREFTRMCGEKFCPECEKYLSSCEKWNIDFAERHDMIPKHVLGYVMNGSSWNL